MIWMNYTNAVGGTFYSYFGTLQQNLTYLYNLGLVSTAVNQLDDLSAFTLAQADGIHILKTLASATDASTPTPGLKLSFERIFPNSVSGRYRVGALGRGWTHNWDQRLVKAENGDVTVIGPAGALRTFKPEVRGGYLGALGDRGQLVALPDGASASGRRTVWYACFCRRQLDYVADPNGTRITCGYAGNLLTSLTHSRPALQLAYSGRLRPIHHRSRRAPDHLHLRRRPSDLRPATSMARSSTTATPAAKAIRTRTCPHRNRLPRRHPRILHLQRPGPA